MPSVQDVYFRHKSQLLRILPLEDPFFIAELQGNGFLRGGNLVHVINSERTRASKVVAFLTTAIEPSVQCGETTELEKLLFVMERFNDSGCRGLACQIRNQLNTANEIQPSNATGTADSLQSIQSSSVLSHQNSSDMGLNTSYLILLWQLMIIFMNYFIPQRTAILDNCGLLKIKCLTASRVIQSAVWELQMLVFTKSKLLLQLYNVEDHGDTFEVTLIIPENFIDHFSKTFFVQNIGYHGDYNGSDGNGDHDDNDNNEGGNGNCQGRNGNFQIIHWELLFDKTGSGKNVNNQECDRSHWYSNLQAKILSKVSTTHKDLQLKHFMNITQKVTVMYFHDVSMLRIWSKASKNQVMCLEREAGMIAKEFNTRC